MKDLGVYSDKKIFLVGLGGIGSYIVDDLYGSLSDERKKTVRAMTFDTNINDIRNLVNVPENNRITLAASTTNSTGITIGQYFERNPEEEREWFVDGFQKKMLYNRKTENGAKQIRMVSRIALSATFKYCNLQQTILRAFNSLIAANGLKNESDYLVYFICSIAGGTGAGTVLEIPLFMREVLKGQPVTYASAMIFPGAFSNDQTPANYVSGQANAYAVLRELKSLNSGKISKSDILFKDCEFDVEEKGINELFDDILVFDRGTYFGESIEGSLETKMLPLISDNIKEYLFGYSSGYITGTRDNVLSKKITTLGGANFSAVGRAELFYPDEIYKKYCSSNWVESAMSENWLIADIKTNEIIREKNKEAREKNEKTLSEIQKRIEFCSLVGNKEALTGQFFNDIRAQISENSAEKYASIEAVETEDGDYVDSVIMSKVKGMLNSNENIDNSTSQYRKSIKALLSPESGSKKADIERIINNADSNLNDVLTAYEEMVGNASSYEKEFVKPSNADKFEFLENENALHYLYVYIRNAKFHPIALKFFLYKLSLIINDIEIEDAVSIEGEVQKNYRNKKADSNNFNQTLVDIQTNSENRLAKSILFAMKDDVEALIKEVEGMFKSIIDVKNFFADQAAALETTIDNIEDETKVLVGSKEGMQYCWKALKSSLSDDATDDENNENVIDETLSKELAKLLYGAFIKRINTTGSAKTIIRDTQYKKLLCEALDDHYFRMVDRNKTDIFPANIVEAVKFEAHVRNFIASQIVDYNTQKTATSGDYSFKNDTTGVSANIEYADGIDLVTPEALFRQLLEILVRKSDPICGHVIPYSDDEAYFNRSIYFDESILPVSTRSDELGNISNVKNKNEFMTGVSTNSMGNYHVHVIALPEGDFTSNKIVAVSSAVGLELSDFANLCDAPNMPSPYYEAYKKQLDDVINETVEKFTPHIHRDWHKAGYLDDITQKHTTQVDLDASKAFVYGFVFDTIRINQSLDVVFGENYNDNFDLFDAGAGERTQEFKPLTNAQKAKINPGNDKSITDAVLYDIFKQLATSSDIRNSIIKDAKERIERYKGLEIVDIAARCLNDELCVGYNYKSIIDVIDGFYQGGMRRSASAEKSVKTNLRNMFTVVCQIHKMVAEGCSTTPAEILDNYNAFVDDLYDEAICDDDTTISLASDAKLTRAQLLQIKAAQQDRPFAPNSTYSREEMKKYMEIQMNKRS